MDSGSKTRIADAQAAEDAALKEWKRLVRIAAEAHEAAVIASEKHFEAQHNTLRVSREALHGND